MPKVEIKNQVETDTGWEFTVETPAGTDHIAKLDEDYWQDITGEEVTPEALIEASFTYLLEREPASAILSEFNLRDIETYFPDYPEKIEDYLAS